MILVQKMWQELLRALAPIWSKILDQAAKSRVRARGPMPVEVVPREDAKVISILPYLQARAAQASGGDSPVQIIDIRRTPRPKLWKRVLRSPGVR